jgi:bacillithiol system protein YtxJ
VIENRERMNWKELQDEAQLKEMLEVSKSAKVLLFKHSTRCATSRMMLDRLQRNWKDEEMSAVRTYYLDLISYRQISNAIAEHLVVPHESPQAILISRSQSLGDWSHFEIEYEEIRRLAQN